MCCSAATHWEYSTCAFIDICTTIAITMTAGAIESVDTVTVPRAFNIGAIGLQRVASATATISEEDSRHSIFGNLAVRCEFTLVNIHVTVFAAPTPFTWTAAGALCLMLAGTCPKYGCVYN